MDSLSFQSTSIPKLWIVSSTQSPSVCRRHPCVSFFLQSWHVLSLRSSPSPLLSSWCSCLDSAVGLQAGTCGQRCPHPAPTGCFVPSSHFDSRRQKREGCTRNLTASLADSKKTCFQAQVSILPTDTGRFRPNSTVPWAHDESHPQYRFISVSKCFFPS